VTPPRISNTRRRALLVRRHHLGGTAVGLADAVRGVVALHSTDPATPYLGARARVGGFRTGDLDRALLEDRSLWRLHAMRRTLFVVPAEEGPLYQAAVGEAIAGSERRRLEGWLAAEMAPDRVPAWLSRVEARILDVLGDGAEFRTGELSRRIPELAMPLTLGSGKWTTRSRLSSRLLFLLAMEGRIVRTRSAGSWRSSQYHWAATREWFGRVSPPAPHQARARLARRYLAAYGPATIADLRWWTGWTMARTRTALQDVGAVPVGLEGGAEGHLLPEDLEAATTGNGGSGGAADLGGGQVSLLPSLDPTTMGWKERDWYLGPHGPALFDSNGNAGPTIWIDGRVVGGWAQRRDGHVVARLLEDVGREAATRVEEAVGELTTWMAGVVVTPRFRTPLERELSRP
jgi:hypothetical protein